MSLVPSIANSLWLLSNLSAEHQFKRALGDPEGTQSQLLKQYLDQNKNTAYGKTYGFNKVSSYEEFSLKVPLIDYEDLEPWIMRLMGGEDSVLTQERVTHLVPTSGSSGACKFIPFTKGLQAEFNRAIGSWILNLYRKHPSLMWGTAYWSITPKINKVDHKPSVLPVGFDDDASYLGGTRKSLVSSIMTVPSIVQQIDDVDVFRYVTLLCLLRARDLKLISVWHPSFLSLLLDSLSLHWEPLLKDIEEGGCKHSEALSEEVKACMKFPPSPARAKELRMANPITPLTIWPFLRVVSCWGDVYAEFAMGELQKRMPGVMIQPKGLLATEACITIPFNNQYPIALTSHFFEFIDERGKINRLHELEKEKVYEVVVTTAGGLWRYRLKDQVLVTEYLHETPCVKFIGRTGNMSDRFGEKLSDGFVGKVIQNVVSMYSPKFAMLAPDKSGDEYYYTLFVEGDIPADAANRLDEALHQNLHYAECRILGQLKRAHVFQIKCGGYEAFIKREISMGKRLGEIKPCFVSRHEGWAEHFRGEYITSYDIKQLRS
jgi:hypothetical protein